MRPVSEVRPVGPEDRPPELKDFDLARWARPEDLEDPDEMHQHEAAHARWRAARRAWCDENGVSYLEMMIADRRRNFPGGVW